MTFELHSRGSYERCGAGRFTRCGASLLVVRGDRCSAGEAGEPWGTVSKVLIYKDTTFLPTAGCPWGGRLQRGVNGVR